jgi:hypothetical protein
MNAAPLILLLASAIVSAQTVTPDRKVVPGYVYSYESDGLRHYSSKRPAFGGYRAIAYSYIETTGAYRINGRPCETDCAEEVVGYRKAKRSGVTDIMDCPKEPQLQLEARGCSLWILEQRN